VCGVGCMAAAVGTKVAEGDKDDEGTRGGGAVT
jgi:hypothetical protein